MFRIHIIFAFQQYQNVCIQIRKQIFLLLIILSRGEFYASNARYHSQRNTIQILYNYRHPFIIIILIYFRCIPSHPKDRQLLCFYNCQIHRYPSLFTSFILIQIQHNQTHKCHKNTFHLIYNSYHTYSNTFNITTKKK